MGDKKGNNKNNKKKRYNGNADEDYNPKFRKVRKKVCSMCANKELVLDYKNYDQMKKWNEWCSNFKRNDDQSVCSGAGGLFCG